MPYHQAAIAEELGVPISDMTIQHKRAIMKQAEQRRRS
jgi:hypothetical protein